MAGEDMLAIIAESRQMARDDYARDLLFCPLCGNRLTIGTRQKMCDVGHFVTPVGTRAGSF